MRITCWLVRRERIDVLFDQLTKTNTFGLHMCFNTGPSHSSLATSSLATLDVIDC